MCESWAHPSATEGKQTDIVLYDKQGYKTELCKVIALYTIKNKINCFMTSINYTFIIL